LSLNTLLLINFIDLHLQEISAILLLANINITGLQKLWRPRQLCSDDPLRYVRKCGHGQVKHE